MYRVVVKKRSGELVLEKREENVTGNAKFVDLYPSQTC